ncbi:type II toxin-antitoxin system VapC family toxin [Bosea sp. FBZP-16]|nr:type II toxin-antitoxin system VapC family toxin [Bosea sp. FBZP-16]
MTGAMIVVDASAALRWFIPASPGAAIYPLPATDLPLVAPDLFIAEVRNTALVYRRKGELSLEQVKAMVATIDRLMAGYFPLGDLTDIAWTMALEFDHSAYDCFYIALARHIDSYLITADERMLRKFSATAHADRIIHLADWKP